MDDAVRGQSPKWGLSADYLASLLADNLPHMLLKLRMIAQRALVEKNGTGTAIGGDNWAAATDRRLRGISATLDVGVRR